MIIIKAGQPANGMSHQENTHTQQQQLKIRSMACLMGPAEFKERSLKHSVRSDRKDHSNVILANGHGSH